MESVDSALRFLQRQFASVANEESQWHDERMKLQQQVRDLETQRSIQEEAYKDAMLRVKMLEFALRQERGRYLVSPAPVSTPVNVSKTVGTAEITRPASASVTINRAKERSVSAHSATSSPPPSPQAKSLGQQVYRLDSGVTASSSSKATTPKTAASSAKGTEIIRPRMGSRTTSSASDTPNSNERAAEPAKNTKPDKIVLGPKGSFRPHKLKVKLSGHMDGVRAIAFHPTEPLVVSGSEDCTVKVWNLASVISGPPSQRTTEMDSLLTVRTHTQSVLSVAIISAENYPNNGLQRAGAFVTAGRDGAIGLFSLPVTESERGEPFTFEEYQGLKSHVVKRAHDDAIWDLHAHPLSNVLFSAGSDGVVRTWGVSSDLTLKSELRCAAKGSPKTAGHSSRGSLVPTSVHTLLSDSKTCVAGYTSGALSQYDFHGEQLIQLLRHSDFDSFGPNSREGQVNQVVVHPTMPVVIAAHQDRKIRMYDMRAGECIGTVTAHQDAVSSISIDASGLYLATGGHDGSLRIWSVAERHCVFEQSAHRPKMGEAVHAVAYHQTRNFIATGGADCTIKIFQ
uniref:Striatin N-terminal domain-containing protein n=1 Tax=Globisporangium ultimum (strain ATCC 200006 / CBS 805.95 / DAOM BR144) TaxID=431595 RepID=K3WU45_GLOUD